MFAGSKHGSTRKRYTTTEDKLTNQQSRRWMDRNSDKAFVIEAEPKHSLLSGFGNIMMLKTSHMACCGNAMGAQAFQKAVFLLGSKICFCGQVGTVKKSNKQKSRWRAAGEGLPGSSRFFLAPHVSSLAPPSTCWLLWAHKSKLT
jgi:hypothetical protein